MVIQALFPACGKSKDPYADYKEVLASGRTEVPWMTAVEKYFPADSMDHFITHYGFDRDPKEWNTVIYFGGRYRMQIVQLVKIDYTKKKIVGVVGDIEFVINEVESIDPDLTASYGKQVRGGPKEWKKFVDSNGDLKALPMKIEVGPPIERFEDYRRSWGKDIIKW